MDCLPVVARVTFPLLPDSMLEHFSNMFALSLANSIIYYYYCPLHEHTNSINLFVYCKMFYYLNSECGLADWFVSHIRYDVSFIQCVFFLLLLVFLTIVCGVTITLE